MNYFLKYRPQTVGDLDLDRVRAAFELILKKGKVSQAYLLTGPKGTGKTSSGRILAKVLHCERNSHQTPVTRGQKKELQEPCNHCESCRAIMTGSHLGVVEMDAASNRGIDDIRTLREQIGLAPMQGRYTVYIIDEVHMLTAEAFNALLKTLEEPPAHAVFILCTTEDHKVPQTISSRCTQIRFDKATAAETVKCLNKVILGEKLQAETGVVELIARQADGSFRDALKMLEQAADDRGEVSLERTERMAGGGELYSPLSLIEALKAKNVKASMEGLTRKREAGADMILLGTRLVEGLRSQVLELAVKVKGPELKTMISLTAKIEAGVRQMKGAVLPELMLELALVEWCLDREQGIGNKDQELKITNNESQINNLTKIIKPVETEIKPLPPSVKKVGKVNKILSMDEVRAKWPELIKAIKPLNHSLEALMRAARPLKIDEQNWLTVEVFYTFHKEQLEQERFRAMLEKQAEVVFLTPIKLRFVLGEKATRAKQAASPEVANLTGKLADEELAKAAEEIFGN